MRAITTAESEVPAVARWQHRYSTDEQQKKLDSGRQLKELTVGESNDARLRLKVKFLK